jgi:hypothetical protein
MCVKEARELLHSKLNRKNADGERMGPWHVKVTVSGRVARVRARLDGGWRVRLSDTGGALAAAEIRPWNPLPLPRQGARIILRGRVHYDEEHGWYVVDPLEHWHDADLG